MNSATDSEERINAGFAALLVQLREDEAPDYRKVIRRNSEARERAQNRVWREYAEIGQMPPSDLALSVTARRELGIGVIFLDQPAQREAAE